MERDHQKEDRKQCHTRGIPLPALRSVRQHMALSQLELAELAGVSTNTVQLLENQRRGAYPGTLRKLAMALEVSPAELVQEHRHK